MVPATAVPNLGLAVLGVVTDDAAGKEAAAVLARVARAVYAGCSADVLCQLGVMFLVSLLAAPSWAVQPTVVNACVAGRLYGCATNAPAEGLNAVVAALLATLSSLVALRLMPVLADDSAVNAPAERSGKMAAVRTALLHMAWAAVWLAKALVRAFSKALLASAVGLA